MAKVKVLSYKVGDAVIHKNRGERGYASVVCGITTDSTKKQQLIILDSYDLREAGGPAADFVLAEEFEMAPTIRMARMAIRLVLKHQEGATST